MGLGIHLHPSSKNPASPAEDQVTLNWLLTLFQLLSRLDPNRPFAWAVEAKRPIKDSQLQLVLCMPHSLMLENQAPALGLEGKEGASLKRWLFLMTSKPLLPRI